MQQIQNYRDLIAWQKAIDIVDCVYLITKTFPKDESYGLSAQLRRASCSVASNIAEGSVKRSKKEFARFVNMAYGSLAEIDTQIVIASRQKYITNAEEVKIFAMLKELGRILNGLRNSLIKSANTN